MSAAESFRAAMRDAGIDYNGPILVDGVLHRFKAHRDKGRNSWYVLYGGERPAGSFGCWKRGVKETWFDRSNPLSKSEYRALRVLWQQAEQERARLEAKRQETARKIVGRIMKNARNVSVHPYLSSKQVGPCRGMKEYRSSLVLPLQSYDGTPHSLQFINADGSKRFLTGGRISGCYFELSTDGEGPLVICEGYATGASIHQATRFAVTCAMHAGNLKAVAEAVRKIYPDRHIVIAADNDQFTVGNPGVTKAREAAETTRATLAIPQFQNLKTKPTDFNDLHCLSGLDEVAKQIHDAISRDSEGQAAKEQSQNSSTEQARESFTPDDESGDTQPDFPLDSLPPVMALLIAGIARCERVPVTLPAVCALGIASAAIGAGIEVQSAPNRRTRANLFLLASAESGSGKSETFRIVAQPLLDHQARLLEIWRLKTAPRIQSELRILEKEISDLEKKAAKCGDQQQRERMVAELEFKIATRNELARRSSAPCLIAQDVTTERMAVLLYENRETLCNMSPDARKVFDNILGRYSSTKSTDESLYLCSYSGDFVRVDRQGRDSVVLNAPCLTVFWMVQPDIVALLFDEKSLSESGFLPRVLICDTKARPCKIEGNPERISDAITNRWANLIDQLLSTYHRAEKAFRISPTPEAMQFLNDYHNSIVDRRNADLADVGSFAARWAEQAWRVAVVLHCVVHGSTAHKLPLAGETALNAIRVVEWFTRAQLQILAKGRRSAAAKVEIEVLELLENSEKRTRRDYITARDVYRNRVVSSPDAARALLERMESEGLLNGEDIRPSQGGRTTRIYRSAGKNPVAG